jgi:hypothetical protein
MRIVKFYSTPNSTPTGPVTGYTIWLSATDTRDWATRPNHLWPCSELSGNRLVASIDRNGVWELAVNGNTDFDVDGTELGACIADHLPADCRHLWPCWDVAPHHPIK